MKRYLRRMLALLLAVTMVVANSGFASFADIETVANAETVAESIEPSITATETESKAELELDAEDETEAETGTEEVVVGDDESDDWFNDLFSDDYLEELLEANQKKDYVPEEIIVSVRGGIENLYLTDDSETDTSFLNDLEFESLLEVDDSDDTEDIDDEDELTEEPEECEILKVTATGYKTKSKLNKLINKFLQLPAVEYAELNNVYSLDSATPSDLTDQQWSMNATVSDYTCGIDDPYTDEDEKIVNWDKYDEYDNPSPLIPATASNNDPVVVIMDTGVDYNHIDLKDVMWDGTSYMGTIGGGRYGYNALGGQSARTDYDYTDPMDEQGHGTHCAGVVAASWNKIGISGMCAGVKIMSVKIAGKVGGITSSDILRGFNYIKAAQEAGVNIVSVNCSWGGVFGGDIENQCMINIGKNGAVFAVSSGNDSRDLDAYMNSASGYDQNPYVVVVNSYDDNEDLSDFSNYGLKATDVAAPGTNILSTVDSAHQSIDMCASSTEPIELTDSGEAVNRFDTNDEYFKVSVERGSIDTGYSYGLGGGNGAHFTTSEDTEAATKVSLYFDKSKLTATPGQFGFAIRFLKKAPSFVVFFEGGPESSYLYTSANTWRSYNIQVTDGMIHDTSLGDNIKRISFVIAGAGNYGYVYDNLDFYIDNIMFTNDLESYALMSGTSMAAPHVTGEAAILMDYFYNNDTYADEPDVETGKKLLSERAKNIAARIRGSVKPFDDPTINNLMQSGGLIRVDKALRGETNPVINDVKIINDNGKYVADLNGYFFDGNAGAGEDDEEFISLMIDGKEIPAESIISIGNTGEQIRFYIPEECVTDEHLFTVTSTKGAGNAYFDCYISEKISENRFVQLPMQIDQVGIVNITDGIPLGMEYYNGNMYLLETDDSTGKTYLWKQDISGNTPGNWQIKQTFNVSNGLNMALLGNKLKGVTATNGEYKVWEFNLNTDDYNEYDLLLLNTTEANIWPVLYEANNKLFMSYAQLIDNSYYKTYLCEIYQFTDPSDSKQKYQCKDGYFEATGSECTYSSAIIYEESYYYAIGGINLMYSNGSAIQTPVNTICQMTVDEDQGFTTELVISNDMFDQISNMYNDNDVCIKSAAKYTNNGEYITLFTGPAVKYGDYFEADTYMLTDFAESPVPINKFVSTTALQYVCCAIAGDRYYVIANTSSGENNWIYAYVNISDIKPYVHTERTVWGSSNNKNSTRRRSSSGGGSSSGGSAAKTSYPSYVDTGARWIKQTDASGKITWKCNDSSGQACANRWMAIPDSGNKGTYSWYWFDANGVMVTGWFTDNQGRTFYFNKTSGSDEGKMLTGWQWLDNKWNYFNEGADSNTGALVPGKIRDLEVVQ